MTSVTLGALALILVGPAAALLVRWRGLHETPGAALVLWQSLALSAVLSVVGAGLALVPTLLGPREGGSLWRWAIAAFMALFCLTVLLRLALTAHRVGTSWRRARRRHRDLVDLISTPIDTARARTRMLEHGAALAYCLPSLRGSRIVVTTGAVHALSAPQLKAVLAHERAHVQARHDLVLEAFTVLYQAFPAAWSSRAALQQVQLLTEVLADHHAAKATSPQDLARALATLSHEAAPIGSVAAATGQPMGLLARRAELLSRSTHRPVQAALVFSMAGAALALPTLLVVVPWLARVF